MEICAVNMAFLSARPGLDERVNAGNSGTQDIVNFPAFREHVLKVHKGINPFEREPGNLERAASEKNGNPEDFQKDAAKQQERVILYGQDDKQNPGKLYGARDSEQEAKSLYHSGHAASGNGALTCCNTDFLRDGSTRPHEENKSSYNAGPGAPAASGGYVGAKNDAGTSSTAHLYKKAA